jgi:hypothetical protein
MHAPPPYVALSGKDDPLNHLRDEIRKRVRMLKKRAEHPGASKGSLRMEYDEIRGMCIGYYIASGAWPGQTDPRETITDYARDTLGLDLPELAATAELA